MQTNLIKQLSISIDTQNVLFIGGPTASGKTGLAVKIATELIDSGQLCSIISADSRQIYLDMTVCTAKPIERDSQNFSNETFKIPVKYMGIDHYLFDIKKPNQRYTLFDFKEQTEFLIDYLQSQGQKVIVVGGTGLYIDSVINNYTQKAQTQDQKLKAELLQEYKDQLKKTSKHEANIYFWNRLNTLSVSEAANIAKNNWQGVLRALEVYYTSKESKAAISSKSEPKFPYQLIVLNPPRQELYNYINQRCSEMLDEGLIEETKSLLKKYSSEIPAMTSIGYREFKQYLEGSITKDEALQKFQKSTRNYAKRQVTWFRRYKTNPHTSFIDSYKLLK